MARNEVTILDVAKYILEKNVHMTAMKLQKLCFYVHAWYLVENPKPIFSETFEAWANGPVSPVLYSFHRQMYSVDASTFYYGNSSNLSTEQKKFIDTVLEAYSPLSAPQLSMLSHSEDPWIKARNGLPDGAASNNPMLNRHIRDFYKKSIENNSGDVKDINWPEWLVPEVRS